MGGFAGGGRLWGMGKARLRGERMSLAKQSGFCVSFVMGILEGDDVRRTCPSSSSSTSRSFSTCK
jgi:hypothetical protein